MRQCLYCQHDSDDTHEDCPQCGTPLPIDQERARQRRLRRFAWYCAFLTLFCLVMMIWLPR